MMQKDAGFSTRAIHGGGKADPAFGSLTAPIYQTSTFCFETAEQGGRRFAGEESGYVYSRLSNPSQTRLEQIIASLEGGEAGLATASGMGAISSVIWTAVKSGDHIVADKALYGCTYSLLQHGIANFGVETTFVDTSDLDAFEKALRPNTKVVYFETPANPNLKICDIESISRISHNYNKDILVVVDNTFCTPYMQRPIELGVDVVIHSATKYLNGHGDVIAGLIVGTEEFVTKCRLLGIKDMTGAVMAPFDAFLIARGIKTLEVRMEKHCANAAKVVEFLGTHPNVEKIYYPGLPDFPGHEIAKKQMNGMFGGMISFEVKGGKQGGIQFLNSLKLLSVAVSLGDTETLIQHPASMTHSTYTAEELADAGISEGLIRFSVGLENVEDIIADLKQGLDSL